MCGQAVVTWSGSRQTEKYGALSNDNALDDYGDGVGGRDGYYGAFCEIPRAVLRSCEEPSCDS